MRGIIYSDNNETIKFMKRFLDYKTSVVDNRVNIYIKNNSRKKFHQLPGKCQNEAHVGLF